MHITHVVEDLNRGGLERVVIDLINKQIKQGHKCQVVCLFRLGVMAEQISSKGIPVHSCDKQLGFDYSALLKARKYIKEFNTEVLHTHNVMSHYYGVFASLFLNIKMRINTRHNMGTFRYSKKQELLYKSAMLFSDYSVLVCEAAKKRYLEIGSVSEKKAKVVPNGIMVGSIIQRNHDSKEMLSKEVSTDINNIIIGAVGRLTRVKDHYTLIKAFEKVKKINKNVVLVIIGGGELKEEMMEYIEKNGLNECVKLLGDRSDVYQLLGGMDVYAVSSISEGHSIALLEACAAALPIVATEVGGNGEIVQRGVNGLLVPPQNPDAMAEGLMSLIGDPDKRNKMGNAGRMRVEQYGSVDVMAKRYNKIYAVKVEGTKH